MQLDRGAPPVIILQATAHATVSEETGDVDDDNVEVPAESELEGVHGGAGFGDTSRQVKGEACLEGGDRVAGTREDHMDASSLCQVISSPASPPAGREREALVQGGLERWRADGRVWRLVVVVMEYTLCMVEMERSR